MASINIKLRELTKLINFFLNEKKVEEIKDIRVQDEKMKFKYNAGKLIPNIPLSVRIDGFKKGELILEIKEDSIIPLGNQILKAANSFIENLINSWLSGGDDSDKFCIIKNNFIYIPIDSLEERFFGDFPFRIDDIEIDNEDVVLKMKI